MFPQSNQFRASDVNPLRRYMYIGEEILNTKDVKRRRLLTIPTRLELASAVSGGIEDCHAIMDSIRHAMTVQGIASAFSEDQSTIHNVVLGAVTAIVYKDFAKTHEREIKEYNNYKILERAVLFSAPRRIGKTWCTAALVVALFLNVPNIVIIIIANGKRAAGSDMGILGLAQKILAEHFNFTSFKTDNAEQLVAKFAEGDIRRISSFSGEVGDG